MCSLGKEDAFIDPISTELNLLRPDLTTESALFFGILNNFRRYGLFFIDI